MTVNLTALDEPDDEGRCLDRHGDDPCEGPVEFHSIDPGRLPAWPRCAKHWSARLDRREHSIEKFENSDVPPPWFQPGWGGVNEFGERWEDEG